MSLDIDDADALIVIATRPQGFRGVFNDPDFRHIRLRGLTFKRLAPTAVTSSSSALGITNLKDQVLARLNAALAEKAAARLMRTPLQVTIMYLLLERPVRPPQARHSLFEAYFDTIYAREAAKPGRMARLLEEHRSDIVAIHELVGLELQLKAESSGEPSMDKDRLHSISLARLGLDGEGYSDTKATALARDIVRCATDRLAPTPVEEDNIGFEVRSLQEYMAARALTTGLDVDVVHNMRAIAVFDHWRNVWLLAAGRIFARREGLRDALVNTLRILDASEPLARVGP